MPHSPRRHGRVESRRQIPANMIDGYANYQSLGSYYQRADAGNRLAEAMAVKMQMMRNTSMDSLAGNIEKVLQEKNISQDLHHSLTQVLRIIDGKAGETSPVRQQQQPEVVYKERIVEKIVEVPKIVEVEKVVERLVAPSTQEGEVEHRSVSEVNVDTRHPNSLATQEPIPLKSDATALQSELSHNAATLHSELIMLRSSQADVDQLRQQISQTTARNTNLEQENISLQKELFEMKKTSAAAASHPPPEDDDELRTQNAALQQQLSVLRSKAEVGDQQLEALKSQLSTARSQIDDNPEVEALRAQNSMLVDQLSAAKSQTVNTSELEALKAQNSMLSAQLTASQTPPPELEALRSQNAALTSQVQQLQQKPSVEPELEALRSQKDTLTQQLSVLKSQLSTASVNLSEAERQNADLSQQVTLLETDSVQEADNLQRKLDQITNEKNNLATEVATLKSHLTVSKQSESRVEELISEMKSQATGFTAMTTNWKNEAKQAESEISALRDQLSKSQTANVQNSVLRDQLETVQAENELLKSQQQEIQNQLTQSASEGAQNAILNSQIGELRAKNSALIGQVTALESQASANSETMANLKSTLTKKESKLSALKSVKTENKSLADTVKQFESQLAASTSELHNLQSRYDAVTDAQKESQISQLKSQAEHQKELSELQARLTASEKQTSFLQEEVERQTTSFTGPPPPTPIALKETTSMTFSKGSTATVATDDGDKSKAATATTATAAKEPTPSTLIKDSKEQVYAKHYEAIISSLRDRIKDLEWQLKHATAGGAVPSAERVVVPVAAPVLPLPLVNTQRDVSPTRSPSPLGRSPIAVLSARQKVSAYESPIASLRVAHFASPPDTSRTVSPRRMQPSTWSGPLSPPAVRPVLFPPSHSPYRPVQYVD